MIGSETIAHKLNNNGFNVIEDIYTPAEVEQLLQLIEQTPVNRDNFRKTNDLFAIRQFLKEVPQASPLIFNKKLITLIDEIFGSEYFVIKSIYFDKPPQSNWFVAYHQDLTIAVDKKTELPGFTAWTVKQNRFAVQPPIEILRNNFTIRIHLDDTDEHNGALKVIERSNQKGIYRPEKINWANDAETICKVKQGGIMLMKPLLLHASNRSTDNRPRRVIHIEFSNTELPAGINWLEKHHYRQNK